MATIKTGPQVQFAGALHVGWMFSDRWNTPGAPGLSLSRPNPVGRTLTIGTEAGEYQFTYTAPVPKSLAELAMRMQVAFPHIRVRLLKPGPHYGAPGSEYAAPSTDDGITFHPQQAQCIVFDMLAGGDGAMMYVKDNSTLAPLLQLSETLAVHGINLAAPRQPGQYPRLSDLVSQANTTAFVGALVAEPSIRALRNAYDAIMADLGGIIFQADELYKQAKAEANTAIDARIAAFRAQLLPTFRRVNRYDNVVSGALSQVETSTTQTQYQDFATVTIPACKAGDHVSFAITANGETSLNSGTFRAIVVDDYQPGGSGALLTIPGAEQGLLSNVRARVVLSGRVTIENPGPCAVFFQAKVNSAGGTISASSVRIDACHDAIVTLA